MNYYKQVDGLIKECGHKLSLIYGKGYDYTNLSRMKLLYLTFPIWGSLNPKLTWTHYRYILQQKLFKFLDFGITSVKS